MLPVLHACEWLWSCRSVDASAALAMEGVRHYISAMDVPGSNMTGADVPDEELFATEKVLIVEVD